MAFTPQTQAELEAAGYSPIGFEDAKKLRGYGVPIVQSGLMKLADTRFRYWSPLWAKRMLQEWPLNDSIDDYDHFRLKQVIRWIARNNKPDMVDAFLTVARLGGERAVEQMLESGELICGS